MLAALIRSSLLTVGDWPANHKATPNLGNTSFPTRSAVTPAHSVLSNAYCYFLLLIDLVFHSISRSVLLVYPECLRPVDIPRNHRPD